MTTSEYQLLYVFRLFALFRVLYQDVNSVEEVLLLLHESWTSLVLYASMALVASAASGFVTEVKDFTVKGCE